MSRYSPSSNVAGEGGRGRVGGREHGEECATEHHPQAKLDVVCNVIFACAG